MWNNIKINNDTYMISITYKNDTIKVFLTNLIEIWIETLTKEIILDRCRKLNPLLNVEAIDYNDIILNILSNMSKYIVEASIEHIKLRAQIDGGLMKFYINLEKGTSQDFWEIITKPLYISSMEIIRQHKILLDLIKKKDEEIAEYKAEGAELIRKNIETKFFTEEQFKIDIPIPNITDYTNTFQRMMSFYNELNFYNITFKESTSNDHNKIQQTEILKQNLTSSIQNDIPNDNKNISNIEDMKRNIANSFSENKKKSKNITNKKVINKIGTANLTYRPVKILKKELEHLPEMLPRRGNNKIKRKRCRQCTANGLRKETNYFCPGCKDNPGLCLGKCFKEYHKFI
ncbi:uncharacterized protein LOC102676318 isoform X1 [Apis dorsata]|uniref:uncharacterized protein LOC102676318 isoform X1 n=1 Tax=Apis dorsata TaxID=7462 RepID=UPI0012932D2F|nr:uncharacterized protein LOC102676318 isoform X1 [Apis dorsata]